MESSEVKLSIWTEGLGEFWGIAPDQKERRQRDNMSPEELADVINAILEENDHTANGLFALEAEGRILNLALTNGVIEMSDPKDINYQNVAIAEADLVSFLTDFFARKVEQERSNLRTPLLQAIEYTVAVIAILALGLTIRFVIHYLEDASQFMPNYETTEIGNLKESKTLTVKMAGVYATRIDDGEMILELKTDGTWGFFDIANGTVGSFILNTVSGGNFRPVYESGRLAILTDTRYLFYPGEHQKELIFLDRRFKRIGNTRDDLPFVSFPDEARGKLASL
jgi:hypothetical protein